jgi:hypothetical protein
LLQGSGQILPQALPLWAAVMQPLPSSALPCLSQLPRPISPFSFRQISAGSLNKPLLLLLRGFLGFSLLCHHGPPSKVKEAKHEAHPYCDGLFNRRNKPQRIESFRLSTSVASGPEEEYAFNISRSPKKYFRRITHIKESSKRYLIA